MVDVPEDTTRIDKGYAAEAAHLYAVADINYLKIFAIWRGRCGLQNGTYNDGRSGECLGREGGEGG